MALSNFLFTFKTMKEEILRLNRIRIERKSGQSMTHLKLKIENRLKKLTPSNMDLLIQNYNSTPSQTERDNLRKLLTETISGDPSFADLLTTEYCKKTFQDEELYNYVIAASFFGMGDHESSLNTLKQIQSKNPTISNYLLLANSLMDLNKNLESIDILKKGLQKYPNNFDIIMSIGTIYFSMGDIQNANIFVSMVQDSSFFKKDLQTTKKLSNEIHTALKNKTIDRRSDTDIYDDEFVKNLWHKYWDGFNLYSGSLHNESYANTLIQNKLGKFLSNKSLEVNKIINFGVLNAYPDYSLAKKFPNTKFLCIDRQLIIQELNESCFNLPNLSYMSGDIINLLSKIDSDNSKSVFHHVRTTCLCYPEFIKLLYKKCFKQKIEYIVLLEPYALCKPDKKFYDFKDFPDETIGFRNYMFLHNYPKILSECGYEIVTNETIPSRIGFEGLYRGDALAWIIAKRKNNLSS
jgi:tetratricopeptide (TPR) repeat protein